MSENGRELCSSRFSAVSYIASEIETMMKAFTLVQHKHCETHSMRLLRCRHLGEERVRAQDDAALATERRHQERLERSDVTRRHHTLPQLRREQPRQEAEQGMPHCLGQRRLCRVRRDE